MSESIDTDNHLCKFVIGRFASYINATDAHERVQTNPILATVESRIKINKNNRSLRRG